MKTEEASPLKSEEVYFEFTTKDPGALNRFYGKQLGFKTYPGGDVYIQVVLGHHKLTGFRKDPNAPADAARFYIHVQDVESARKRLEELGLNPTPISKENWGHPATEIRDPEGRMLVFTKQEEGNND